MTDSLDHRLQDLIEQMNAGDQAARNQVMAHACERLRCLARKMLHQDFGRLRDREQTDDVLNGALLRLHRALDAPEVRPSTPADFFRLATVQLRRELLDLARHYFAPGRPRPVGPGPAEAADSADNLWPAADPSQTTYNPERLQAWRELHQQITALPTEEREVFELLWYQELTQAEAAAVLGVSVPTVKRRWLQARLLLQEALGGSGLNW
jgi:RNA polymerase sigma-70 factor (ECF subfamily)